MFERAVLHLDMDTFFVSVECLRNPALLNKPVVIAGMAAQNIVASCSDEARRFGIRPLMPVRAALQLCPDIILLQGDWNAYENRALEVAEILEMQAPVVERTAAPGEFYVDLSGMDRYVGCWHWSQELRRRVVRETGLPLSISLAVNKLVSKVGTSQAGPSSEKLIAAGEERAFLAPLPVGKLPGAPPPIRQRLQLLGVRMVHTLREIPPPLLQFEFGVSGTELWRQANAIDDSPVRPWRQQKSIEGECLLEDTVDIRYMHERLTRLVADLAFQLRKSARLTACIGLKLRYADGNTYRRQCRIPLTACDKPLLRYAGQLLEGLFIRRQLVRLIGVQFTALATGYEQMNLFEDRVEDIHLLQALDRVRTRFGTAAIQRAATL